MDLVSDAVLLQRKVNGGTAVSAVGVKGAALIGFADQFRQGLAVVKAGFANGICRYQFGGRVRFDMVFIPVMTLPALLGVPGIGVLLAPESGPPLLPSIGRFPSLIRSFSSRVLCWRGTSTAERSETDSRRLPRRGE